MWPDGSGKSSITWQQYATIEDMSSDGRFMCIHSYRDDMCYVTDGSLVNIPHSYSKPGKSGITFTKFVDSKLLLVENDPDEGRDSLYLIDPVEMKEICLGKLPESDNSGWGMCSVEQVFPQENKVYLALAWYDGTAMILSDYCIVEADLEKENSVKVISSGIPDAFEEGPAPHFYFNYADEIMYTTYDPENPFVLSEKTEGDLVYLDSPFGANLIAADFIKGNPYMLEDGREGTFLQTAERIGNDVYVLTARAKRSVADDIGWREAFELIEFTWQVFEPKDGAFGDGAFGDAKILK